MSPQCRCPWPAHRPPPVSPCCCPSPGSTGRAPPYRPQRRRRRRGPRPAAARSGESPLPGPAAPRPAVSAAAPSAPPGAAPCGSTLRRKPAAWPVFWLRSSRRSPEGSDKTAALTPAPAPLILLATSASLSPALMRMSTGWPLAGMKEWGATLHWPSSMRNVPARSAAPTGSSVPEAVACALARLCTSTSKRVGKVPPGAVAETYLLSDDAVLTLFQPVTLANARVLSSSVATSDLSWPNAEILVLTVVACCLSASSGFLSSATNWEMMFLTSRPLLPMPGDEMVAIPNLQVRRALWRPMALSKRRRQAGKPVSSGFAGPGIQRSRARTLWGSWFAWATIAVPACCRIWARDRLAVSAAKSASRMRERDADRFSEVTCRLSIEVSKRDCNAPSLARWLLMKASPASTVFRASVAFLKVVTSRPATSRREEAGAAAVVLKAFVVVAVVEKDLSESSTT